MLDGYGKSVKKEILRLNGIVYEREMNRETAKLLEHFREWESGKLDVFQLNDLIHEYHNGPSRELYKQYVMGQNCADFSVACGIRDGLLKPDEVSPDTMAALQTLIRWKTDVPEDPET